MKSIIVTHPLYYQLYSGTPLTNAPVTKLEAAGLRTSTYYGAMQWRSFVPIVNGDNTPVEPLALKMNFVTVEREEADRFAVRFR